MKKTGKVIAAVTAAAVILSGFGGTAAFAREIWDSAEIAEEGPDDVAAENQDSTVVLKSGEEFVKNKDNTMFGTAGMASPGMADVGHPYWTGSKVYFGKYNDNPVLYNVLDKETRDFNKSGDTSPTMLLDCSRVLFKEQFGGFDNNEWKRSYIHGRLSNTNYFANPWELDAVAESYKLKANDADGDKSNEFAPLTGEKFFILDVAEVTRNSYGFPNNTGGVYERRKDKAIWWLRTPSAKEPHASRLHYGCYCKYGFSVNNGKWEDYNRLEGDSYYGAITNEPVENGRYVSPALNISLPKLLFSSLVSGTMGEWGAIYKLTLLTDKISVSLTPGEKVTAVTAKGKGTFVTVPYTVSGKNNYCLNDVNAVSVLITDGAYNTNAGNNNKSNIIYYGKLKTAGAFSKTGTGSFVLPDGYGPGHWGSKYRVYLIPEVMNGEKESDIAGTPVEIVNSSVRIASGYTVTFDANGHGTAPDPQVVISGEKAVKPANPTESNWVFNGWYTDQKCSAGKVYDFDNMEVRENKTLYAKWGPDFCTVTFDMNGGDADKTPSKQSVRNGNCAKQPKEPPMNSRNVYRDGYYFCGWNTKKDGNASSLYDFSTPVEDNLTLYAYWKKVCNITFDKNGGSGEDTINATKRITKEGDFYEFPECPFTPPSADQKFTCWTDQNNKRYYAESSYRVYDDLNLKATWHQPTYRTVNFIDNKNGNTTSIKVVDGQTISDKKPADPTADGCIFLGWYTKEYHADNIAENEYLFDFESKVTKTLDLYAAWLNNNKYHFIVKSGAGGTIAVDKEYALFPDEITFTVIPDTHYKLWYIHHALYYEHGTCKFGNVYPKDMTGNTYTVQIPEEGDLDERNIIITANFQADHEHVWDKHSGNPPECEGTGTYGYAECKVCHHKFKYDDIHDRVEEYVDLSESDGLYKPLEGFHGRDKGFEEPVLEKAATCSACGNIWYMKCKDCGRYIPYSNNSKVAVDYEDVLIPIDPNAHDWDKDNVTYTWEEDNSLVTASYSCKLNPNHKMRETVETKKTVTKEVSCEEDGAANFTASGFTDPAFEDQTKTGVVIKKTGHDWGEPEYEWSADHSECTATVICKNDESHKISETAASEKSDEDGISIYTADFENPLFYPQTARIVELSFDMKGKTVKDEPETQEIISGSCGTEPSKMPSADGVKFAGWFRDSDCTGHFDFTAPLYRNTTVYVKWVSEDTELFTVSFDLNGQDGTPPSSQLVEKGGNATCPRVPTAEGYSFTGWFTDRWCQKQYDFSSAVTKDITLYAGWQEEEESEPEPEPEPEPEEEKADDISGNNVPNTNKLRYINFNINTKDTDGSTVKVELYTVYSVNFNGKKHIEDGGKTQKSTSPDVSLSVNSTVSAYAKPGAKFKNNKNAAASDGSVSDKKKPRFILKFKANSGATKEQKKVIKQLNKELKAQPVYFDIEPADLAAAKVSAKVDAAKNKATKVTATIDDVTMKLGKKDYDVEFTDDKAFIIGKRNFKGRQEANK